MSGLRDAAARQLGRSEFARPLVLEAGAGTGKMTGPLEGLLVDAST